MVSCSFKGLSCTGPILSSIKEEGQVVQMVPDIFRKANPAAHAVSSKEEAENAVHGGPGLMKHSGDCMLGGKE